ncbi:MAG: hypothetical protein COX16_05945 [Deltaproteobacteria bacterium CG23_combo_of_CG06-09_8_20_14_all_51_20]|nr:MAG: hypothetical protein COX16_05945 [Deltaproteobacteria bacterium CG23_combo_of_CG06-09_8_20_14_all_51_20]
MYIRKSSRSEASGLSNSSKIGAAVYFCWGDQVMPVQVFLNATLRKRVKSYDAAGGLSISLSRPVTVAGLCDMLRIPKGEIKLIMIDGRAASLENELKGNERVGLFPPVGGG